MSEEGKIKGLLYIGIGLLMIAVGLLYKISGKLDMLGAYTGAANPGGSIYGYSIMIIGGLAIMPLGHVILLYGLYRWIKG